LINTGKSRKKSRCPGERPNCSYCERLGQRCVYNSGTGEPDVGHSRHDRKMVCWRWSSTKLVTEIGLINWVGIPSRKSRGQDGSAHTTTQVRVTFLAFVSETNRYSPTENSSRSSATKFAYPGGTTVTSGGRESSVGGMSLWNSGEERDDQLLYASINRYAYHVNAVAEFPQRVCCSQRKFVGNGSALSHLVSRATCVSF
jgi:hypothetical protein